MRPMSNIRAEVIRTASTNETRDGACPGGCGCGLRPIQSPLIAGCQAAQERSHDFHKSPAPTPLTATSLWKKWAKTGENVLEMGKSSANPQNGSKQDPCDMGLDWTDRPVDSLHISSNFQKKSTQNRPLQLEPALPRRPVRGAQFPGDRNVRGPSG